MKKTAALILCMLLSITLFGCRAKHTEQTDITTITNEITSHSVQSEKNTISEKETTTTSKTAEAAVGKSTSTQKNSTEKSTTEKSSEQKSTTHTISSTSTTQVSATTTASSITCTVTVECKEILNNMSSLKEGHEDYISDGVFINNCSITLLNGATAYDAVKTACTQYGISMNVQTTSFGKYIVGFNGIDEFDCGKQSGWVYTVNGKSPPKSSDKYPVSNGDKIVYSYTCSYN